MDPKKDSMPTGLVGNNSLFPEGKYIRSARQTTKFYALRHRGDWQSPGDARKLDNREEVSTYYTYSSLHKPPPERGPEKVEEEDAY